LRILPVGRTLSPTHPRSSGHKCYGPAIRVFFSIPKGRLSMRRPLLAIAILSLEAALNAAQNPHAVAPSASRQRAVSHPSSVCLRHDPVGFFTSPPEILGELGQVFANCYPHPSCANPTDLETIQIDGYGNSSGWLWTGPSSTTFTVAQQDMLVTDAINRAGTVPGKVIVNITFFKDLIVGNQVTYFIYLKVTFARCSQAHKGMTWIHPTSNVQTGHRHRWLQWL